VLAALIALVAAPTPISAYGGRVAWSAPIGGGRFALMTHTAGGTVRVPVAPRRVPFDVDLGPTAGGHVAAVYSRCRRDPPPSGAGGTPALYERGRGCDVFEYDFATGRERLVAEASSPVASESWPAIWRTRLAFERTYDAHRRAPLLYIRTLGSRAPSRRLPTGPRRGCAGTGAGARYCGDPLLSRATGLDLRGRRLAFSWTYGGPTEGLETEIRIDTLGARPRLVARQHGGGLSHPVLEAPALDGAHVLWAMSCWGDPGGCLHRTALFREPLAGGRITRVAQRPWIQAVAAGGGTLYVLRDPTGTGMCEDDPPAGPRCRLETAAPF